jgi:hypothetical protein
MDVKSAFLSGDL